MTLDDLTALKERHYHFLTGIPGVTAIGVGMLTDDDGNLTDTLGLIIYHESPEASLHGDIRTRVGDVPLQVRQGVFTKPPRGTAPEAPHDQAKADEQRRLSDNPREQVVNPMVGGISGSPDYWSWSEDVGTIGMVLRAAAGTPVILSNHHVICRDNPQVGDDVSQPARVWFGDLAAKIVAWEKGNIVYQGTTYGVDAAVASPANGRLATIGAIYNLPTPTGSAVPTLGMNVVKSGVTTDITNGVISGFYDIQQPNMRNQIGIQARRAGELFSDHGDSGSGIIDTASNNVVGLLWGGANNNALTLASPIIPILNRFNCTVT